MLVLFREDTNQGTVLLEAYIDFHLTSTAALLDEWEY